MKKRPANHPKDLTPRQRRALSDKAARGAAEAQRMKAAGYVCASCDRAHGGTWPDGLCATWHRAKCDLCEKNDYLAAVGDWDWPLHSPLRGDFREF